MKNLIKQSMKFLETDTTISAAFLSRKLKITIEKAQEVIAYMKKKKILIK